MIRVNLLPHREEKRKARRTQFFAMTAMIIMLCSLIWFFGFMTIGRWISTQDEKNNYLKKEIAVLDKDIAEIKTLKSEIEVMLARNRVIEALQSTRAQTVHLFTELARLTPEGVYLKNLKQTGLRITMSGYAQANARVSDLMQKLSTSPLLKNPVLVEIRAVVVEKARLSEFNMTVEIQQQAAATDDKKGPVKAGAVAPAAKAGAKP